jgi:hypothetical protein
MVPTEEHEKILVASPSVPTLANHFPDGKRAF